jgi:hypothetical protein
MKLPNFLEDPDLNELRARMGATELGAYRLLVNPYRFSVPELEELIHAGIDIKYLDEVRPLADRTLAYKDRRVMLHLRDSPAAADALQWTAELPNFHIADCATVRAMRKQPTTPALAVSAREDGDFRVNLFHGADQRAEWERLPVCEACLEELPYDNFSAAMPAAERSRFVREFTIRGFFERYRRSLSGDQPD